MVRSRLHAPHIRSVKASRNGELVGSAFISRCGSLAVFGPLTVDPDAWGLGIGSRLLDACVGVGAEWGVTSIGLFTLPESPKHLHLYRKHGFRPARSPRSPRSAWRRTPRSSRRSADWTSMLA